MDVMHILPKLEKAPNVLRVDRDITQFRVPTSEFNNSNTWRSWTSNKIDPLAIIEASLTSVKYAFYQALGYAIFRALGYDHPNLTLMSSIAGGFIGGAIFTLPYLILLPADRHDGELRSPGEQAVLLGSEMLYSGVASGIGMLLCEGWTYHQVLMGVCRGAVGPFVSFAVMYAALRIVLGVASIVMSKNIRVDG